VAVLPTSAGKSAIYQLPALVRDGLVVVISPLVALMADQVERLRQHGVDAYFLNSHCSAVQKRQAMDAVQSGRADLLYLSPERLQGVDQEFFGKSSVQMYAIDEAHCISEWGHDFRPPYMKIGRQIGRLGDVQRIALTATATREVVNEIASVLNIDLRGEGRGIFYSPDRPNIAYGLAGAKVSLLRLVENAGLPSLVYGSTRKSVEEGAKRLQRAGYSAAFYHAGMSRRDRMRVQERFSSGEYEVITATCAFGMGIDHSGIRSVVHLEMPTSLEAYMQESGRAGRDGSPSRAICRRTHDTLHIAESLVSLTWPEPARVLHFWREIQALFEPAVGKWSGEGVFQLTNDEIGNYTQYNPIEVGACLRVLDDADVIRRTTYQDRPVTVTLLSGASKLTGSRQKDVTARLAEHADGDGNVVGSVAFFSNVIGMDLTFATPLNRTNAIQFQWVERCQIVERTTRQDPKIDADALWRIRRRALRRIRIAKDFIDHRGCHREYLLAYFGASGSGAPTGQCCAWCG
jgi:ATP-dependent DNA helicase RecQ